MQSTPPRIDTSIGALLLFPQRYEDIGAFSKLDADASATNRLRAYLPSIAARDGAAIERGTSARIDAESCAQLSDDDIERVAEAYLSLPEVRQMEQNSATSPNTCVRSEGEAASGYLDRLLLANHERQMLDPRATFESFHDSQDVTPASALGDLDRQSASLRQAADAVIQDDRARHADSAADSVLAAGAGRPSEREEEIALARGNARISTQSALLLASLSQTASQFLNAFVETARRSEEATRKSLRIAVTAACIAALFSIAALVVAILSYRESREHMQRVEQAQESVLRAVQEAAAAEQARSQALAAKLQAMADRQTAAAPAAVPAHVEPVAEVAAPPRHEAPKSRTPARASKPKSTR
jgi:hypothetical protein